MGESESKPLEAVPQETPGRPEGMTEAAWQKMNLLWGMVESLENPPSEAVQAAAPGDEGIQTILSMTEGLMQAGEKLNMPSDKVSEALRNILKPKAP